MINIYSGMRTEIKKGGTQKGAAVLIAVLFFVFISLALVLALSAPALAHLLVSASLHASAEAFSAAESGVEDAVYRFKSGRNMENGVHTDVGNASVVTTYTQSGGEVEIESEGVALENTIRRDRSVLQLGDGVAFNFGVQAGEGGFELRNSALVDGNVFSAGPVDGQSNDILGSVLVASDHNTISDVVIDDSAHAYRIEDSHVGGDAYYQELSNTTVMGDQHPDTDPPDPEELPISDDMVEEWKTHASSTEVINCSGSYTIDSDETLGPTRITCDLDIRQDPTITLEGHVWVEGDIIVRNTPTFEVDGSLGDESVAVIADDPSNRTSGSTIELRNTTEFNGAPGSDSSYVLLLSQNEDAELGGGTSAITVEQSTSGDLLVYAGSGEIRLENSVSLKEVTAYRIHARNSAEVIYETGLADTFFSSGPGGGYSIVEWKEVE